MDLAAVCAFGRLNWNVLLRRVPELYAAGAYSLAVLLSARLHEPVGILP